jgi:O-acetyl-ADP-ribose deacetylase (regulator of RNase III)
MEIKIHNSTIRLCQGDITTQKTDAIVNAANSRLAGGGGVDGAIHRVGGSAIMEECRKIGSCPPGNAVITTGGKLPASYVIHAVGPIYRNGTCGEPELLKKAFQSCMKIAAEKSLKSIAFPSISTGAYGYPIRDAARIAITTVLDHLTMETSIERVVFVLFNTHDFGVYKTLLESMIEKYGAKIL